MSTPANRKTIDRLRTFAEALDSNVVVTEKFTCKKVVLDLQPQPFSPEMVQKARSVLNVSQSLFAEFLGVSPSTIRDWEQGRYPPKNLACRFMEEIIRDPEYWTKRVQQSAKVIA
ncbi:MAG: helix-turn-helix domain-containing protein [Planctomycetaceae bacterium]|nr:helix-turn-helix domain-containing protein [Planctomycetaceae bacterium]